MDDCRSKLGVRRWELADRGKAEGEISKKFKVRRWVVAEEG
jgi:hypothetical protein